MLHTKFRGNRPAGSGKIFEEFSPYMGVAAIVRGHVPESCHQIFISLYQKAFITNLVQNSTVISEKIQSEFLYVHDLGLSSRNDLDLQYSHNFINLIRCLLLPTFRSLAAIVSEKSTVLTFSYGNKTGQGQRRVIIWTNFDGLDFPMLHTKFHGNRSTCSGEEDF